MPASVPLDLPLRTPDGAVTTLGEHLTRRFTVVQLVRYFGCLPCQDWAVELDRRAERLAGQDVGVMAVGGATDYQAQYLHDERGVGMPLLLDPEQRFRAAVGADKSLGLRVLDPRSGLAYAKRIARGDLKHQRVPAGDGVLRSPGVVVLDTAGRVVWSHIGTYVGDYPSLGEVLAAVSDLR